jgi:DNA end-binding protein Ku
MSVAARGDSISFNQIHRGCGSRIKQVLYCAKEDRPITRDEIEKGYEFEKDQFVTFKDEEIKGVAPKTHRTMEIVEFVKADSVDPVYFESSYYLAPEDGGAKAYSLLFAGMKKSGYYGVAKLSMHNREHIVILRPCGRGLMLHTMYYRNEVRASDEFQADPSLVADKELALAGMLIESLAGDFTPDKYSDTYRANLEAMIAKKVDINLVPSTNHKLIDIGAVLEQSIAQRKPATKHGELPARKKRA